MVGIDYKKKFEGLAREYIKRDGIEALLDSIAKTDFYTAPASTRFHDSNPQGLVIHSINVFEELMMDVNNDLSVGRHGFNTKYDIETLAIISLFHDICKIGFYKVSTRNTKDEKGKWIQVPYYEVEDKFPIGHGEKSIIMLREFMKLTSDEMLAIRWHMGQYDDSAKGGSYAVSNAYNMCPLAVLLNIADIKATYLG